MWILCTIHSFLSCDRHGDLEGKTAIEMQHRPVRFTCIYLADAFIQSDFFFFLWKTQHGAAKPANQQSQTSEILPDIKTLGIHLKRYMDWEMGRLFLGCILNLATHMSMESLSPLTVTLTCTYIVIYKSMQYFLFIAYYIQGDEPSIWMQMLSILHYFETLHNALIFWADLPILS